MLKDSCSRRKYMKQLFEKVFKSKFIKNVTIMATGAAGAQIIALLTLPIITRLYGPEAYGILGTFNSFVNIIVPIAALTYPIAIVLPKSQVEALGIIRLSTFVTSGFSILEIGRASCRERVKIS